MLVKQPEARICGPPIVIYHDHECKENGADVEVAVPVSGRVTVDDGYEVQTLEGGRAITMLHHGAYWRVGETWGLIHKYLDEHDCKVIAPGRELYLNDPGETGVEDLLTEVQVLVK